MVMEAGARVVLVGHSERRQLFGETDEQVAQEAKAALGSASRHLVCVGETLAERDGGRTEQVIVRQLGARAPGARAGRMEPCGAGIRASVGHRHRQERHPGRCGPDPRADPAGAGAQQRSVAGAHPLRWKREQRQRAVAAGRPQIDGVLVGGASLDPEGWAELVEKGSQAEGSAGWQIGR